VIAAGHARSAAPVMRLRKLATTSLTRPPQSGYDDLPAGMPATGLDFGNGSPNLRALPSTPHPAAATNGA
jgi:hypothetical protein